MLLSLADSIEKQLEQGADRAEAGLDQVIEADKKQTSGKKWLKCLLGFIVIAVTVIVLFVFLTKK